LQLTFCTIAVLRKLLELIKKRGGEKHHVWRRKGEGWKGKEGKRWNVTPPRGTSRMDEEGRGMEGEGGGEMECNTTLRLPSVMPTLLRVDLPIRGRDERAEGSGRGEGRYKGDIPVQ
jgi:hypothetical protein